MMTVKQLRERVEWLLEGRIGSYRTPNGTIPAVWVGNAVPSEYTFIEEPGTLLGIEVIIQRTPTPLNVQKIPSGETLAELQYQVLIIQHLKNAGITEELLLLVANLRQYRSPVHLDGSDTIYEQATIYPSEMVAITPQVEDQ